MDWSQDTWLPESSLLPWDVSIRQPPWTASALDSEGRGPLYRETGQDDSPRIRPGANLRRQPFSTAYFLHELALLPLF